MAWQDREKEWANVNEIQLLVGRISMIWSQIDLALIEYMANLTDLMPGQAAIFLKGSLPSKKTQTALDLIEFHAPEGEWSSEAKDVLKLIRGKLNSERNRFVHDVFNFEVERIARHSVKDLATNPDAAGRSVQITELRTWCEEAGRCLERLHRLTNEIVPWTIDQRQLLR